MPGKDLVAKIVGGIAVASQIVSAFTWIYWFTRLDSVSSNSYKWFEKLVNYNTNAWFYSYNLPILMGILSGICAILEILLIVMPMKAQWANAPLFRGSLYIGTTFLVVAVMGDLGIVAGIIQLIAGLGILGGGSWASI